MSLYINKDKLIVNVLVICSLCLLITPINTSIDLSFTSLAFKQSNSYPNRTNSSAALIEILELPITKLINQTLSTFNGTDLNVMKPFNADDDITKINITKDCYNSLYNAYFGEDEQKSKFFLTKLIHDSSKSKDELLTHSACMTRFYGYNEKWLQDIVYLEVLLDQTVDLTEINSTIYETLWSIFGICAPIGCTDIEYARFLYEMFYDLFNLTRSTQQIEVLPMNAKDYRKREFNAKVILQLIPMLIIVVFFFIIVSKWFPFCCFRSCFMNNRSSQAEKDVSPFVMQRRNSKIYNRTEFKKFKISMLLKTHISELFGKSKYTNDTGMTYIKGVRGIAIILSIFGFLFFALFNNPISIYHEDTFINMLLNIVFVVFFVGIRYAPRLLFSCSGFCVYYKLICYLDDKSREESQRRIEKKKRKQKAKESKNEGDKVEDDESDDDDDDEEADEKEKNKNTKDNDNVLVNSKVLPKDIKWIFLVRFYLNQIHKYIVFVLIVLVVRYSIIPMDNIINKASGPMWNYYKEKIVNAPSGPLIQTFLLVRQLFMNSNDFDGRELFVNYLWMISAEMIFFLAASIIIFVGYKYKYRFNYILILCAGIVIAVKLYYLFSQIIIGQGSNNGSSEDTNSDDDKVEYNFFVKYQTLYYNLDGSHVLWNPFLNYIYFYIGTIFGAMNYIFQKKITYEMIVNSDRLYLESAQSFLKKLADRSKKFIYIIGFSALIVIIVLSFTQSMYLKSYDLDALSDDHCSSYITSIPFNILYYFDIEVVVFLVNFMAFSFNLKGNNYMNNMFSHSFWFVFEKIYFLIILLANPIILYILSQIELRITLNIFNVILFSFISLFYVLLFSCVCYMILELPLKKLIKVIVNAHLVDQNVITQDEDDTNEEQIDLINYLPIMNEEREEIKNDNNNNDNENEN